MKDAFDITLEVLGGSNNRNLNYCSLYIVRGKILFDLGKLDESKSNFDTVKMIYKRNSGLGEYCTLRLASLYKELGNV